MLGESFIHVLKYRQDGSFAPDITRASNSSSTNSVHNSCPHSQVKDTTVSKSPTLSDVKPVMKQSGPADQHRSPDLYFCKTYASLSRSLPTSNVFNDNHQAYPDMHQSSISQSQKNLHSMNPEEWLTTNVDESAPQQLRFIPKEVPIPDNGYLVMDSSIMLNGEPPTNSMINGYLDRKLQEVYSQYLQERLSCPGTSPGYSLLPLPPFSQQMCMDLSLEPEARPSQVPPLTNSQGHLSQRASSNFSSPVLRISNAEPKRPGHSD